MRWGLAPQVPVPRDASDKAARRGGQTRFGGQTPTQSPAGTGLRAGGGCGRTLGGGQAERPLDRALRLRADHGGRGLAVLEEDQRGYRGDAVSLLELVLRVDVDLDELELVLALRGDAVEHGRNCVARAAPLGPEVHEDGLVGLDDLLLEGLRCYIECHWSFRFVDERSVVSIQTSQGRNSFPDRS